MKKLFTLLTLALLSIGSAWASTVDDLTSITSATTIIANTLNGTSALEDATLYADGKVLCVGGCGYSAKSEVTYNETKYTPVYQIKSSRQLVLKIGFNATITVVGSTNSGRAWRIGTTSAGNEIASGTNGANFATGSVDGSSTAQTVYINASGDLYIAAIIISSNSSPVITASGEVTIKATKSGVESTEGLAVTGSNLTGSTLTATLSPAVPGMNVTLGSSAITTGAISTTATLHYTATANAKGSTTLTLSDGTTSKDVTVNYKALVVPTELAAISTETTFDLSKVGTSGLDAITVDDDWVVLTDAGSEVSFADNLAVAGISGVNVTWRADAIQAPLFKFKTTVPGTVTVKFSDVGSSSGRANRYANVNGVRSDVYSTTSASAGVKTCAPIAVSAGEVIIKGQVQGDGDSYTDNQIRVFTITFTPSVPVTIAASGYSSLASAYGLNFAGATPAGLEAYVASAVTASGVTLNAVTEAPASTGIILKGTPGATYTIPVKTDAAAIAGTNYLHAAVAAYDCEANEVYILKGGKFCLVTAASTVPAGKAYLLASDVPASAPELEFNFGGTTGINAVNGSEFKVNGEYYNLAGQRVAQPTKGLYIVNGRKVVIK